MHSDGTFCMKLAIIREVLADVNFPYYVAPLLAASHEFRGVAAGIF